MLTFDVAYITTSGVELILVPVGDGFAGWPPADQLAAAAAFRRYAAAGGMTGVVVPVWRNAAGRAVFLVPPSARAAVEPLAWEFVTGCINYRVRVTRQAAGPRHSGPSFATRLTAVPTGTASS